MKRTSSMLIGLVAAAVTFASLMAFVGHDRFARYGYGSGYNQRGDWRYRCDGRWNSNDKPNGHGTSPDSIHSNH